MWSVIRKGFRRHALMVAFAGAALVAGLGVIAPESAQAATLYISEFSTGVTNSPGSDQVQAPPQAAITDQTVALSGSTALSSAFNSKTHAVMLVCDEGCSVKFGTSSATATTSNYLLQQGVPYVFGVAPGQFVAAIANAAGNTGGGGGGGGTSSTFGAAFPATGTAAGFTDGTNMAPAKVDGSNSLNVDNQSVAGTAIAVGNGTTSAGTQRVTISSDSTGTVGLNAGENHTGEVGGNEILVQVAQTVTASSAYASGNAIGGLMTISGAARVSGSSGASGTSGLLQSVVMNIKSAQTTPVDIFIFNANPTGTTCTDKSAIAIAAADFDKVLGVVHMTDFTSGGTPSDGQAQNLAMPYALTSATTIYACAVTRSTPTYAATTDVSFGFRFLRN